MPMIFIFGFSRKYLQGKKIGRFENPWTKHFRDLVFSNYDFPSQNLHKKYIFLSQLVQIHVHEPQSGARGCLARGTRGLHCGSVSRMPAGIARGMVARVLAWSLNAWTRLATQCAPVDSLDLSVAIDLPGGRGEPALRGRRGVGFLQRDA